jgi:thiamine-monophosphate kinase
MASDLTEEGLIADLLAACPTLPPPDGPGDDAALLSASPRVITTDILIESTHFLRAHPMAWLGWKALMVNLSDVSAMGAHPEAFLVSVAIPDDLPRPAWQGLCAGLGEAARAAQVHVVGGDTVRSPGPLCLTITAWGRAPQRLLRRSGGRPGDILMTTGPVGRSGLGLARWLRSPDSRGPWSHPLPLALLEDPAIRWHLRPEPPLWAGPLAAELGASAAMDLSDGLATDLPRLARASGVALRVDLDALPSDPAAPTSPLERAASGEDYGLVILAPPEVAVRLAARGFHSIGLALEPSTSPAVHWHLEGRALGPLSPSFAHFGEVRP